MKKINKVSEEEPRKVGRPRKDEKRSGHMATRVTDAEKETTIQAADREGIPTSDFIRACMLVCALDSRVMKQARASKHWVGGES